MSDEMRRAEPMGAPSFVVCTDTQQVHYPCCPRAQEAAPERRQHARSLSEAFAVPARERCPDCLPPFVVTIVEAAQRRCRGVVDLDRTVEAALAGGGDVYALRELVHNEEKMAEYAARGVKVVPDLGAVPPGGTLVTRSHGEPPEVAQRARQVGLQLCDGTCEYVKELQQAARALADQGYLVVLYGKPGHPEMRGVQGVVPAARVVEGADGVREAVAQSPRVALMSQTTMRYDRYAEVTAQLAPPEGIAQQVLSRQHFRELAKGKPVRLTSALVVVESICRATIRHQAETASIARESDMVIVVGGRKSANTRHLTEIAAEHCEARQVNWPREIECQWLLGKQKIGVVQGVSTPGAAFDRIREALRAMTDGCVTRFRATRRDRAGRSREG